MKRKEIIEKLISEGFSPKTLVNFDDKQLLILVKRVLSEATEVLMTKLDKNNAKDISMANALLKDPIKNAEKLKKTTIGEEGKLIGKQTKLDKNKNGKIDSEDFKMMKKKNVTEIESDSKKIKIFIICKDLEKDGGNKHKSTYSINSTNEKDAKEIAIKKWFKENENTDMSIMGVYSEDEYSKKYEISKLPTSNSKEKKGVQISEWVKKLANENFSLTSKSEIMEIISQKLNNVKTGHNGVPEFMTYDSISGGGTEIAPSPVKTPVKKPSRLNPFQPNINPGIKERPKAENGGTEIAPSPVKTPVKKPSRLNPFQPNINPGIKERPKAEKYY
jgi:hypothetical protein